MLRRAGSNDASSQRSESFVAMLRPDGTPDPGVGQRGITKIPVIGVVAGGMVLRTDDRLVLICHDNVLARLLTSPPAADISMTIATPHLQVGPGPVPFRATVRNAGPATTRRSSTWLPASGSGSPPAPAPRPPR
jgi:hypothetical protein